jgi:hypothetical protein
MVAFDESSLQGLDLRELAIGDWVEYERAGQHSSETSVQN